MCVFVLDRFCKLFTARLQKQRDGPGRREEGARQGEGGKRRGHIKLFAARENAVLPLHWKEKKRNAFLREGTSPSHISAMG